MSSSHVARRDSVRSESAPVCPSSRRAARAFKPRLALAALALASSGLTACTRAKDPASAAGGAALVTCMRTFVSNQTDVSVAWDKYTKPVVDALFATTATVNVDRTNRLVTATSTYDGKTYTGAAAYREGFGCTSLVSLDAARLRAQSVVPPDRVTLSASTAWPAGGAGPQQLAQQALIDDAVGRNLFATGTSINTHAVAIAQNGRFVYERYGADVNASTPLLGFSLTKTVLALGLGMLWDENAFELEDRLPIAGWETQTNRGSFRQFLQMESGISWNELGNPYLNIRASIGTTLFGYGDQAAHVASRAQASEPGAVHTYSTGNSIVLSRALQNLLLGSRTNSASDSLQAGTDFFHDRLFSPLRITSAVFQADEAGTLGGGSMAIMTARDWLRLGQLVLDGGRAHGAQLVSSTWLHDVMLAPSPKAANYGGHIWLGDVKALSGRTGDPIPVAYFSGMLGQKVIVVPSRGVVFVRLGTSVPDDAREETFAALDDVLSVLP